MIICINRGQYERVLEQADTIKLAALVNFVGGGGGAQFEPLPGSPCASDSPPRLKDEWITFREAADGTPYSQEYLSLLARSGKIEAVKRGWVHDPHGC